MTLPQLAYEAYRAHTGGISLASGQPIPAWAQLKPEIQEAWRASTNVVALAVTCDGIKAQSDRIEMLPEVQGALIKEYLG